MAWDHRTSKIVTIIGIPSAFLLHGYVGFIFGSVKANPWWGSVLMPIVFLMSAIVSGIAMVMLLYMVMSLLRNEKLDMRCLDKVGLFLLVAIIVDFALEALDYIHRLYQSEESIKILGELVSVEAVQQPRDHAGAARHAGAAAHPVAGPQQAIQRGPAQDHVLRVRAADPTRASSACAGTS